MDWVQSRFAETLTLTLISANRVSANREDTVDCVHVWTNSFVGQQYDLYGH